MSRFLISYRQEDSGDSARRLYDRLSERFGKDCVLMDLQPGSGGPEARARLFESDVVLLVMIGKRWLDIRNAEGRPLLDNPADSTRSAIEFALRKHLRVIPVLVQGAVLPRAGELPEGLKNLAQMRPMDLRENRWELDENQLISVIEEAVPTIYPKPAEYQKPAEPPKPKSAPSFRIDLGLREMVRKLRGRIRDAGGTKSKRTEPPVWEKAEIPPPAPPDAGSPPAPDARRESESPSSEVAVDPAPVFLGASAPQRARPGDEFTARFVAYVKELEEEVRDLLEKLSPRSETHLQLQTCRWKPGTKVKVRLSGRELRISPAEDEFTWEGGRNLLEFDVEIPSDVQEGATVLKFDAAIDGIIVARLRLDLEVSRSGATGKIMTGRTEPFRTAFASYSSEDRPRVLDRISAVSISAGLDVFLDCLSLHPGEQFKPRLAEEIGKRDLFLLFWSEHAKDSKWVTWEWETALQEKGRESMQIHPLQPDIRPPKELEDLHFGDPYMWIRKASEASSADPANK